MSYPPASKALLDSERNAEVYKAQKVANPTYQPLSYSSTGYPTFRSFYPYYLGEHNHTVNRRLHLIGTTLGLLTVTRVLLSEAFRLLPNSSPLKARLQALFRLLAPKWQVLLVGIIQSYAWAWTGHFFFERNKPATFKHPAFSLLGDLTLWWQVITLQRRP